MSWTVKIDSRGKAHRNLVCDICKKPSYDMYLVHDKVWVEEAGMGKKQHACLSCLEQKLGRPITILDFQLGPEINNVLFFGYKMGLKNERMRG